ncbi:MAG: sugar transferase [Pseudanabaenaceae cyanobacterium bins.39]|nr:sugar transferase [Pseudanabaenaceae cyanobacterium bins.39]
MLLVTVGREQYQFNALMQWIDILIKYQLIDEDIVVQYGTSTYIPDGARAYRYLNDQDFQKLVDRASLIISHCDESIAQYLEDRDTPYVLVPRLQRFREYIDNHQMEVADEFEHRGIAIARSPGDLVKFIKLQQTSNIIPKIDESNLCQYLLQKFPSDRFSKLMLVCAAGGYYRYMQSLSGFWEKYRDRVWISIKTEFTEQEIEDVRYWGYAPVNNSLLKVIKNLILAFKVIPRQKPDLIVCTGSGFTIFYLLIAKWLLRSKIIYLESKSRYQNLSFPAWLLNKLKVLDLLVVRSKEISQLYPHSVYIPIGNEIIQTNSQDDSGSLVRDYKQASIVTFDEVAFIFSPERLEFSTARQFLTDFQSICNPDESYQRIVIDMSHTTVMDSAGLGTLTNCLRIAKANGTELSLWSASEAVRALLGLSSLSNLFIIEHGTHTFRFSNPIQRTKVANITKFGMFLYRTQRLLNSTPVLRAFYPIVKFFFPWIDIDPSVPVHASVRNPIKRLIDIVGALIGLAFTGLLFPPIALAIVLESKGGVLFGQTRCGLLSKPFRIWKFRSMVQNAEQLKSKVVNHVEATSSEDTTGGDSASDKFFKNANDPRVTKVGKFLRKTSLDEFPQFWNVLMGDMSLVGTRPPTYNEINSYELQIEYHDERYTEWNRLDVKPGITGVWQVNGRSNVRTFSEVVNYDIEYRKNWSIWYDLKLIVQTVLVLFDKKNKAM